MTITDRLFLDVSNRRRLGADITDAVVSVRRSGGVEEVPTLSVVVADPDQELVGSSELVRPAVRKIGTPDALTLRPIDLLLDGTWYRLVKAAPSGPQTTLTFEHRAVAWMRTHDDPMSASRASTTRALFIRRQVDEVGRKKPSTRKLAFWAPGLRVKQPIVAQETTTERKSRRSEEDRQVDRQLSSSLGDGGSLTVAGSPASEEQKRNIALCLSIAGELNANEKATLAMLCAGIGESGFIAQMNKGGSGYGGVFQGDVAARYHYFKIDDTEAMCRCFFKGGKGFQAGGAIALAETKEGIRPGEIALRVEGSLSNFSSFEAGVQFYQKHLSEAKTMLASLEGVDIAADDPAETYTKSYKFRRDKGEDAWDCTGRLAEEVGRFRFITMPRRGADLFVYSDGQSLHRLPAQARFAPTHPAVTSSLDYELDYRKTARELDVTLLADALDTPMMWGFPIQLDDAGAATGKWIVWSVVEDDSSPTVDVHVKAPTPAKPEPRAELGRRLESTVENRNADELDLDAADIDPSASPKDIIDSIVLPLGRQIGLKSAYGLELTPANVTAANARHGATNTGGTSDHQGPPERAWAVDASDGGAQQPTAKTIEFARKLNAMFGMSWTMAKGHDEKTQGPFRFQLIHNTSFGGNHFNHVHFGVQRR